MDSGIQGTDDLNVSHFLIQVSVATVHASYRLEWVGDT